MDSLTKGCPTTEGESQCICDTDTTTTVNNQGWIRWIANGLQLIGYYMLIHDGFGTGLLIKGISDLLIMVWAGYNKLYDVIVVTAIFCVFNFQRLAQYLTEHSTDIWFYKLVSHIHLPISG